MSSQVNLSVANNGKEALELLYKEGVSLEEGKILLLKHGYEAGIKGNCLCASIQPKTTKPLSARVVPSYVARIDALQKKQWE